MPTKCILPTHAWGDGCIRYGCQGYLAVIDACRNCTSERHSSMQSNAQGSGFVCVNHMGAHITLGAIEVVKSFQQCLAVCHVHVAHCLMPLTAWRIHLGPSIEIYAIGWPVPVSCGKHAAAPTFMYRCEGTNKWARMDMRAPLHNGLMCYAMHVLQHYRGAHCLHAVAPGPQRPR